jgi:hypothetical protein
MDYKYIEQILERYFNAETSLEEERILRAFFSQQDIPAEMEQWRALFTVNEEEVLGDDFDNRILAMIEEESKAHEEKHVVKAREIKLSHRLMPLYKAAAVVAIILTLGGALQAPFDNSWNSPEDYASYQQDIDSLVVSPVQAISDIATDSTQVLTTGQQKN